MKRNKAFTLIELLVVIAILAIFAGILVPLMVAVKRKVSPGSAQQSGSVSRIPDARRVTDVFDDSNFATGDKVEIPGVANGVVNKNNGNSVDVLIRNANGEVSTITVQRDTLKRIE